MLWAKQTRLLAPRDPPVSIWYRPWNSVPGASLAMAIRAASFSKLWWRLTTREWTLRWWLRTSSDFTSSLEVAEAVSERDGVDMSEPPISSCKSPKCDQSASCMRCPPYLHLIFRK